VRLLLVDDDAGLRALLRTTFEADNAASAAASISDRKPDAILLDIGMPGMDGLAFCRILKADPEVVEDLSAEYGFLLHDVGKIGIPDEILQKPGPLTDAERDLMQTHTLLGEQMLGGVAFLQGEGLRVVRSHHERWDGAGIPTAGRAPRSRWGRAASPLPTHSMR
jgi:response regulator RpfG family c-di-GMP phosphodiesterase